MTDPKDEKYESFLKLYRTNEGCISRYILALCPNYSAAEDIVQETMLVMWRKFDQFEPGTHFAAWGMQIAHYCANAYFRKNRPRVVHFDHRAFDNIARHRESFDRHQERYLEALDDCLEQLPANGKKMIALRYVENLKVTEIALQLQKTLSSTYKVMSRIHHRLLHCIEHKVTKSEMA